MMTTTGSITVVPTVHFSPRHSERVRETIQAQEPDIVAVELDEKRYERFARNTPMRVREVLDELPPTAAATYTTFHILQQVVVRLYGLDPEETDMKTAIDTAAEQDIPVAPIDEPITDMLTAMADRVGVDTLPRMALRVPTLQPTEWIQQTEVLFVPFRRIDSGDDVEPLIRQLRRYLPEVAEVLIDQRDWAMATRLHQLEAEGHDVVAVVGAGHHNGLSRALSSLETMDEPPEPVVPIFQPSDTVTTIEIE